MLNRTHFLSVVLLFLLTSSLLTSVSTPASATVPTNGTYSCSTGLLTSTGPGTYSISAGEVTNARFCSGAVVVPEGVTSIGSSAFVMTSVISVSLPSSLTSIGGSAFGFSSLRSIILPAGLTSIASSAFQGTSLTSLTIPTGVTTIGSSAFSSTSGLTTYTYCGTASIVGTGLVGKTRISVCSTAPGAPTIGTATATGTTTATVSFTAPASDGGSTILSYTATSSPGSITATLTQATSGTISVTGLSASTSYTFTITALNSVGASSESAASNSITTSAVLAAGIAPLFTSASSYDGRFTVQINNFDPAFTYSVSSSSGQASVNATGLVTVTGLNPDQSVTVSVTTSRTGYASGFESIIGRSQVASMLPGSKPIVTIGDTLITCSIGSYSTAPTSAAFSLFVDGKHISTNFSALGEFLPDWIIPWATSSTIARTATLTSASWSISDTYKAKAITCATLAYSKNAIGFTTSAPLTAR